MENYRIIEYKWQSGVYQLKDLIKMVQNGFINEKDFFNITRYDYNNFIKTISNKN